MRFVAVAVIALLVPTLAREVPLVVVTQTVTQTGAPVSPLVHERPLHHTAASPRGASYDFSRIQSTARSQRLALAGCLMRDPNLNAKSLKLTARWRPQGALQSVTLDPAPASDATACITELVRQWPTRPHPALQPFAYTIRLVPAGT